jgi:hypothetical protein
MLEIRNAYILLRKPVEKRPLGRLKHTWEDNIKLSEILGSHSGEDIDCGLLGCDAV